jgi:Na+/H+-translocating membrane pyrophosphatase
MITIRIIAVLVGIAIAFLLKDWLETTWYIALVVGAIGYFVTRYVGWAISERRRVRDEFEKAVGRVRGEGGLQ